MPGRALGRTIFRRMRRSGMPRVRPRPTKSGGTRLMASITISTCWKKVPIQMMRNFWKSLVPAQRMLSGTKATTGM